MWFPPLPTLARLVAEAEGMAIGTCVLVLPLFAATATGEVWCSDDGGEQWVEVVSGLAPISKGTHYAAFTAA